MSVKARWAVRIAMAAFGLLIAGVFIVDAVQDLSGLRVAADGSVRWAVLLMVIGGLLKGLGLGGVFVCQAAEFRDWSSWMRPVRPFPGARVGFRDARRAARQINGVESYQADEVPRLRRLAEYRVSLRRFNLVGRLAAVSLVVFFVGIVLAPPGLDIRSVTEAGFGQLFRVLGIVMTVVLVAACIVSWRTTTDAKAESFLERTTPVAERVDGS